MAKRSTYPAWVFDNTPIPDPFGYGQRAIDWIESLRHPASKEPGQRVKLTYWQKRIVLAIYGPRHPDGSRIIKTVFLMLPRGSRKTSLSALLALLHTIGPERHPGNAQPFFCALDRRQSSLGLKEAIGIVRMDPRMERRCKIYEAENTTKRLIYTPAPTAKGPKLPKELVALPTDGGRTQGLTASFCLFDEIHVWKNRDFFDAMTLALGKAGDDNLLVIATTAGRGNEGIGAEQYDYARRVALGEIDNPEWLPVLFEADMDDDWRDEKVWHRVCPGLKDGFPSLSFLRSKAKEAEDSPAARYAFAQFYLNKWFAHSRDPLFDFATYDARRFDDDDADLETLPCWLGVDLSRNGDLTAIVAAFKHPDGQVTLRPTFFVPGEDLQARADRDGVPYQRWADDGLVKLCPGPIIDEKMVEDEIRELAARFDVQEIGFDPHLAQRMMQRLYDDGLPVVEVRQGPLTMGAAGADLERIVNGKLIRHDGHPVLRHHFGSVVAARRDDGRVTMHKGKSTDRIDGAIAAAMAVYRLTLGQSNQSAYNDPDKSLLVLDEW